MFFAVGSHDRSEGAGEKSKAVSLLFALKVHHGSVWFIKCLYACGYHVIGKQRLGFECLSFSFLPLYNGGGTFYRTFFGGDGDK